MTIPCLRGGLIKENAVVQQLAENRIARTLTRVIGAELRLPGNQGLVQLTLTPSGGTGVNASIDGQNFTGLSGAALNGLDDGDLANNLANDFTNLGIDPTTFMPPALTPVDFAALAGQIGTVSVGQPMQSLNGRVDEVAFTETFISCTSDIVTIGAVDDICSAIVFQGTIQVDTVVTETTTANILDLTVADVVMLENASANELISLLQEFPDIVAALLPLVPPTSQDAPTAVVVPTLSFWGWLLFVLLLAGKLPKALPRSRRY